MIEKTIKPEEVRIGDHIRVEHTRGDLLIVQTGTVALVDEQGAFFTEKHWIIGPAFLPDMVAEGKATIILLYRPMPPLPTEPGSVIHVTECRGETCDTLALLDDGGWWHTTKEAGGYNIHDLQDITAWEPCEVKVVAR